MHLNDDDLILHYYGEASADEARVETHLSACAACRQAFAALRRDMEAFDAAPVPEPGPSFERTVWARLAPQIDRMDARPRARWFSAPRFVFAGAFAAIILMVGLLVRSLPTAPAPAAGADADAGALRERVMLAAVSDHIEQSEVVLVELANASADDEGMNVSLERTAADDLVSAGRLYRDTAIQTGNLQLAALLEELEMVLVDIARGPEALTSDQLEDIRQQIETQQLIFKLRVLGADVKARQQKSAAADTPQRTL